MIQAFFEQEGEYAKFLRRGDAFVLNDFPGLRRMHVGECTVLNRAGPASWGRHTSVRKICSYDLGELQSYAKAKYGRDSYALCAFCFRE